MKRKKHLRADFHAKKQTIVFSYHLELSHFANMVCNSYKNDFVVAKSSERQRDQVIPGNLQNRISNNYSLLWCKTLPALFSFNVLVHCLLKFLSKQHKRQLYLQMSSERYYECLHASDYEFQIWNPI